jgi:hypothetical protein
MPTCGGDPIVTVEASPNPRDFKYSIFKRLRPLEIVLERLKFRIRCSTLLNRALTAEVEVLRRRLIVTVWESCTGSLLALARATLSLLIPRKGVYGTGFIGTC